MIYTLDDFREGKEYAKLYRDLFGSVPSELFWESRKEFLADLEDLRNQYDNEQTEDLSYVEDSDDWMDELREILPGPFNYSSDDWN